MSDGDVADKKSPVVEEPKGDVAPPPAQEEPPAEPSTPSAADWLSAGTSWGSSWLKSAKEKTFQTLELVKKDLDEFKEVMSTEVTEITNAAKGGLETVSNQVKQQAQMLEKLVTPDETEKPIPDEAAGDETAPPVEPKVPQSSSMGFGWMKNLVDTVKNLGLEDTTEGESEITETIRPKGLRRTNLPLVKLQQIQNCEATFTQPPEDTETFDDWLKKFSMTEHDGEINMLLGNTPALRQVYAKLVPSVIDNQTFWTRYFFKVEIAEIDEEMKYTLKGLTINTEQKQKLKSDDSPSSDSTQRSEPTSGGARSADDWSDMGKDEQDIEELTSNGEDTEKEDVDESAEKKDDSGPLTPKPKEDGEKKSDKKEKEDGWVDWDE